jgi:hypothetical protein
MKHVAPFAVLGALCVFCVQPAGAESPIVGTWKLQSFTREIVATGKRDNPFGDQPHGYASYSPDGRTIGIMTKGERVKPAGPLPTDQEKIELFGSMVSYAGTYQVEGNKVLIRVDISWNQAWTGTVQTRFFKVEGDTLTLTTPVMEAVLDGQEVRSVLVWKKVQ